MRFKKSKIASTKCVLKKVKLQAQNANCFKSAFRNMLRL